MGNAICCRKLVPDAEKEGEIHSSSKKDSNDNSLFKSKAQAKPQDQTQSQSQIKSINNKESSQQENNSQNHHLTTFDKNLFQDISSAAIAQPNEIEDMTSSIIKVQKIVRGKQSRGQFNTKIKASLRQSQMEVINRQSIIYSNLKEAESKVTTKCYNRNGWKDHYLPQTDFFNYDYGDVKTQQVKIIPPSKDSEDNEVSYYTGEINSKNERHGYGILSNSKIKLEGFWRHNAFTGWGRETTLNGNILEGKFIDGKLCGKGMLMNSKGESFVGDFENAKKKGRGKETTAQYVYEGEYDNNTMNGKGTITFLEEKNKYTGDFFNNELTGSGRYSWNSGETYEGTLLKGNYHGKGVFKWPDGQIYEGEYSNGIKEGYGKMTYPNGNIYEGPYLNGNPHGIGKYTKKGKTVNVEFNNGAFVKIIN